MSGLTLSLLIIICGLLPLIIRAFFFVDFKEVERANLDNIKLQSTGYIISGILILLWGIISLFIYSHKYVNPIATIVSDFFKIKLYLGLYFIIISSGFFLFRENIIKNWEKLAIRIPISPAKYRTFSLSAGTIFLIIGLLLIII